MRTMLILVLLCSLAHFAASDNMTPEGCGTGEDYDCYGPGVCSNKGFYPTVASGTVTPLTMIDDSACPAIIKFHQYAKYWVYVSIEGLEPLIESIEFYTIDTSQNLKASFKCFNDAGKAHGMYFTDTKANEVIPPSGLLKCSFDVKLKLTDDIFKPKSTDKVFMEININTINQKTKQTNFAIENLRCDPSDLKFEIENKPTQVYKEVEYLAGKYKCPDNYNMEYSEDGTETTYNTVTSSLVCKDQKFEVNATPLDDYWVYIRCATDAHFFCNYDVMHAPNMEKLVFDAPDLTTKKAGSLKCPEGFPHLFIDKRPPVSNPTIECRNYGGKQYWTVSENNAYMTSQAPLVYCSKTVDCNLRNKIPEKSITSGYVNDKFLPACFDHGTLHVGGDKVSAWCDVLDGKFKYNSTGQDAKPVKPDTSFVCEYDFIENKEADEKNEKIVQDGLYIVIGSVVGGLVVILVGAVVITKCNEARHKRKAKRIHEQGNINFFMKDDEREEARKKLPKTEQQSDGLLNWNKCLMHRQNMNVNRLAKAPIMVTEEASVKPPPATKKGKEINEPKVFLPKCIAFNKCMAGPKKFLILANAVQKELKKRFDEDWTKYKKRDLEKLKNKIAQNRENAAKEAAKETAAAAGKPAPK